MLCLPLPRAAAKPRSRHPAALVHRPEALQTAAQLDPRAAPLPAPAAGRLAAAPSLKLTQGAFHV